MAESRPRFRSLTFVSLTLAAFGLSIFLFPVDSDGSFASFDGVVYGIEADGKRLEAETAFHPLFHVIALGAAGALREAGVSSPGHVAIRVVSGLAAAFIMFLMVQASGRERWMAGAGFALALFATRSFLTNAAVGETIVPGCAAALWAFHEATRTPLRTGRVWTALVISLLMRADNILVVPGIAAAVWIATDRPHRFSTIAKGLLVSAAATILGYILFWWMTTRGQRPIWDYFFPRTIHSWTASGPLGLSRFGAHVDALSASIVGRSWPLHEPNPWIGPGFLALTLVAAFLLRGTARVASFWPAIVLTLLVRAIFFSWYDVTNPKWAVLTLGLIAWFGARLAEGEHRRPLAARIAGGLALVLLSLTALIVHGPFTARLRDRGFIGAMTHAVDEGKGCRFMALGPNVNLALDFLSVPHTNLGTDVDLDKALPAILGEVQAHPEPTLIVYERWTPWIVSGDPYMMTHPPAGRLLVDDMVPPPDWRVIKWEGLAYAARYEPKAAESPPASRSPTRR